MSEHWVYVVRESLTGCIKVGKTARKEGIQDRIKSLQMGCPYELELIATLDPGQHPGERALHSRLAKWRVRPGGEWFYGVAEAFMVMGISVPTSVSTHQDVLNASFDKRDRELTAREDLAEWFLERARNSNDQMLKRESVLAEREEESLHRMRRVISQELVRLRNDEGEWGRWKSRLDLGDYLLDQELVRMIVEEAMNTRWHGVEFRRWLLQKATWGTVRTVGGSYPLIKEIELSFEWYAQNDPEFLNQLSRIIARAKRIAHREEIAV